MLTHEERQGLRNAISEASKRRASRMRRLEDSLANDWKLLLTDETRKSVEIWEREKNAA